MHRATLPLPAWYSDAMGFSANFRCIAGCVGTYPLDQVIYRCPKCGDPKMPHRVCPTCGTYRGEQVVEVEEI